jgi:chromodomain-helicase-DNA-binding protein 7
LSRAFSESYVTIQITVCFLQEDAEVTKAFEEDIETPPIRNIPSPGQLDPDTRIPVINLEDGTRLVGEDAPKNKDLVDWLKLHPTYTVDMPSYVPVSTSEPGL